MCTEFLFFLLYFFLLFFGNCLLVTFLKSNFQRIVFLRFFQKTGKQIKSKEWFLLASLYFSLREKKKFQKSFKKISEKTFPLQDTFVVKKIFEKLSEIGFVEKESRAFFELLKHQSFP